MSNNAPEPSRRRARVTFLGGAAAAGVIAFMLWASQTEQFGSYGRFWSFMYGTSGLALICVVLAVELRFALFWLASAILFLPTLFYSLLGAIMGDGGMG